MTVRLEVRASPNATRAFCPVTSGLRLVMAAEMARGEAVAVAACCADAVLLMSAVSWLIWLVRMVVVASC